MPKIQQKAELWGQEGFVGSRQSNSKNLCEITFHLQAFQGQEADDVVNSAGMTARHIFENFCATMYKSWQVICQLVRELAVTLFPFLVKEGDPAAVRAFIFGDMNGMQPMYVFGDPLSLMVRPALIDLEDLPRHTELLSPPIFNGFAERFVSPHCSVVECDGRTVESDLAVKDLMSTAGDLPLSHSILFSGIITPKASSCQPLPQHEGIVLRHSLDCLFKTLEESLPQELRAAIICMEELPGVAEILAQPLYSDFAERFIALHERAFGGISGATALQIDGPSKQQLLELYLFEEFLELIPLFYRGEELVTKVYAHLVELLDWEKDFLFIAIEIIEGHAWLIELIIAEGNEELYGLFIRLDEAV
jgi:hypothetical protein